MPNFENRLLVDSITNLHKHKCLLHPTDWSRYRSSQVFKTTRNYFLHIFKQQHKATTTAILQWALKNRYPKRWKGNCCFDRSIKASQPLQQRPTTVTPAACHPRRYAGDHYVQFQKHFPVRNSIESIYLYHWKGSDVVASSQQQQFLKTPKNS